MIDQKKLTPRDWEQTRRQTKELHNLSKEVGNIDEFEKRSSRYGIRDALNAKFVKKNQDISRNTDLTPQERQVEFDTLNETHGDHIYNPFLRLPGKYDRIHLLQSQCF